MPYRLEVLGFPRLRNADGSEVEFPRGKPLALLSFLAVESRPVGRDELGELFWPGNSQKRTRHSVRQAIWLIRRTLGEEILQGEDPVAVSGEALSCDLLEFQGAVEAGKIDHARTLWRGPLLSRMSLSGCRGWDHWLEEKRGGLERDFFRILLSQARRSSGARDDEHALECLDQALELNPFSVEGHKLRTETLLDLRQIPRALKALEEAEEEIGDDPRIREELDQLRKRITHQEATDGSETSERLGESVEFVGRSGELADLHGAWRRARAGVSGTACILGPTGIGKTRLAAELLSGVERDGGRIAKARGFRGEHRIPWGTVADLIQELMLLPGVKGISSGSEAVLRGCPPEPQPERFGNGRFKQLKRGPTRRALGRRVRPHRSRGLRGPPGDLPGRLAVGGQREPGGPGQGHAASQGPGLPVPSCGTNGREAPSPGGGRGPRGGVGWQTNPPGPPQ